MENANYTEGGSDAMNLDVKQVQEVIQINVLCMEED
jgi:hypothetical protein